MKRKTCLKYLINISSIPFLLIIKSSRYIDIIDRKIIYI